MKAALTSLFFISLFFSSVVNAREIIVLETFTGTQYSNQLEMPFKPIPVNLKLSDLSQNLDIAKIDKFYTFRHSLEPQKNELSHLPSHLFSRSIFINSSTIGLRLFDPRFEQLLVPFFVIVISF